MAIALESDTWIVAGTWQWIEAQSRTGQAPVYRYLFDQVMATPQGPVPPDDTGAAHATDIPFVFDRLDYTGNPVSDGDEATAELMGAYWTNFAKTADPNAEGLPTWPRYSGEDRRVMRLSAEPLAMPEQHRARYEFIEAQND
jgi:para-nitrobenzyl esterase